MTASSECDRAEAKKVAPSKSYEEFLSAQLRDPEEAVAYLNAAIDERDT
jgi:hypothetical protein